MLTPDINKIRKNTIYNDNAMYCIISDLCEAINTSKDIGKYGISENKVVIDMACMGRLIESIEPYCKTKICPTCGNESVV